MNMCMCYLYALDIVYEGEMFMDLAEHLSSEIYVPQKICKC